MRKRYSRSRVNEKRSHSVSMLRSLLLELLLHGKITTTGARARMLKSYANTELSYATKTRLSDSERQIIAHVGSNPLAKRLSLYREFSIEKVEGKSGSFVRTVNAGFRAGDNARTIEVELLKKDQFMAYLELKRPKKTKKATGKKVQTKKVSVRGEKEEAKLSASKETAKTKKTAKVVAEVKKKKTIEKLEKSVEKSMPKAKPFVERKEGFFTRLGDRILGRRVRGPSGQKGRSTARSGL